MSFSLHTHQKVDGRSLWLYSRQQRDYQITNDLPPLDQPPAPIRRDHPLLGEPVYFNPGRNNRTLNPPKEYNPLAAVQHDGFPGEIPVTDFEVAIFPNRWPSLVQSAPPEVASNEQAYGACEVVVYSTNDQGSVGDLSQDHVQLLLEAVSDRVDKLKQDPRLSYVMPFESRGAFVGVTLPHPHGQIYAFGRTPGKVLKQAKNNAKDQVLQNLQRSVPQELIVEEDADTITFCPEFARYPFEAWVLPKQHAISANQMPPKALASLAKAFQRQVQRYDRLFAVPAPYVLWHALPPKGFETSWPYHLQFWCLQRGASKFKFLASVEQITDTFLVDVMPDQAAKAFRAIDLG